MTDDVIIVTQDPGLPLVVIEDVVSVSHYLSYQMTMVEDPSTSRTRSTSIQREQLASLPTYA